MGNIRVSYFKNSSGSAEVLEKNDYYPFGLKHGINLVSLGNSSYNYQYNGKELQKETGWSDFGARMYMPDIARWGVIDPLAESTSRVSPYNYALNNPVMFIDPDGRKAMAPDTWEWNVSMSGAWGYTLGGGAATFGSFAEFLGEENPLAKFNKSNSSGGGGGGSDDDVETVGETQWYRDLMAQFGQSETEYFKDINFGQFLDENNDCPKCPKSAQLTDINAMIGAKVLEEKTSLLGRLWATAEPRTWTKDGLTYNVDADGKITGIRPFQGDVPLGPAGSFNILKAFKSGLSLFKGGSLTNIGRAVTKHPQYFGFESTEALMKVFRSPGAINKLGATMIKDILRNGVKTTGAGGRYPNGWVTYTLPNGNAASWTIDGVFIGFRGLK